MGGILEFMKIIFVSTVGLLALTAAAGFVLVASHTQEKRTSLQAFVMPGPVESLGAAPSITSVPQAPRIDLDVTEVEDVVDEGGQVGTGSIFKDFDSVPRPVERPADFDDDNGAAEALARNPAPRTPVAAAPRPAAPSRVVERAPSTITIERANLASGVFR
ncbi:hypothetical protein SAMN04488095_3781 [Jannaschia pohangensis]|uniref:Uncharacterized protein n=2 Tax=Jannaschia pohangensis TaxID=390807 RepID=A0A1I3UJY6_9RHOB|nr:hypothetical protein SAMN04488095_3781 [Jannaschia pohangensis]